MIAFQMPSLGADMEAGTLVEWRKKVGDMLHRGDIIADVDTQKGLIEIEVFEEGLLHQLVVKEGDKVPVGTVLAWIKPLGDIMSATDQSAGIQEPQSQIKEKEIRVKISPLAKKMASTHQLDVSIIKGTGPDGEIVKADIEAALQQKQEKPQVKEEVKETRGDRTAPSSEQIRLAVASAMARSNQEIPHYYLEKRVVLTKALHWIKDTNKQRPVQQRILPAALFVKAVAKALDDVPDLNAIWENGLLRKNQINIGFVVSLRSGGLVVPVISSADTLTVDEIMAKLNDLIPRARSLKLRSSEIGTATFTLTSVGESGADKVFGIVYPPQVGIVGFGQIMEQPVAEEGMLGIKPVVDLTLAADHRATDGMVGSKFLTAVDSYLQDPENL